MTQKNPLKQRHKTRQLGEVANCVKLKQVARVTKEEADETVVITVYTFSFDGGCNENRLGSEVDALYVRLPEGDYQCRTVRLNDEIALNIGPGEHLAGIEILDARQVFWWQGVEVENLPLASGSG